MLKAALSHKGTVMLDVVSPCVTFNDHEGSTKSYKFMKDHDEPITDVTFVPSFEEIEVDYEPGDVFEATMHDGSRLRLRKLEADYDPSNKGTALKRLAEAKDQDEVLTGLFYVDPAAPNFMELLDVTEEPLATLPPELVRPSRKALEEAMEFLR